MPSDSLGSSVAACHLQAGAPPSTCACSSCMCFRPSSRCHGRSSSSTGALGLCQQPLMSRRLWHTSGKRRSLCAADDSAGDSAGAPPPGRPGTPRHRPASSPSRAQSRAGPWFLRSGCTPSQPAGSARTSSSAARNPHSAAPAVPAGRPRQSCWCRSRCSGVLGRPRPGASNLARPGASNWCAPWCLKLARALVPQTRPRPGPDIHPWAPLDPLWTPSGPFWTLLDPSGPLWTPSEPFWTPWDFCGPLWTPPGPLWTPVYVI